MPAAIINLAKNGLLWTGAQHAALSKPAPVAIVARTRIFHGPILWENHCEWDGRYHWTPARLTTDRWPVWGDPALRLSA